MTHIRVEGISVSFKAGASGDAGPGLAHFGLLVGQALGSRENQQFYRQMRERQAPAVPGGVALAGVSLEALAGETLSIIGPSGCGKTTLLKVIAGLQAPDAGRVYFDDRDVTNVEPGERGIGMVFQTYALYPHLRSRDNVSFFFHIHRRQAEIPARVRAISEMMGLNFHLLLDRKPPKLSGGEQQRVAVARCIARDPTAFLFDEPLAHLDAKLRMQLRVELKRLLRRFEITSLYVTHDQQEAIALGERIGVMRAGRIEQVGSYAEVYGAPANVFVAGFIGSPPMNLWPATLEAQGMRLGSLSLSLPGRLPAGLAPGAALLLGVRPEHLRPAADGPLALHVEWAEPRISDHATVLYGSIEGQPAAARLEGNAAGLGGQTVRLTFEPALAHLFDASSGRRLG